MNGGRVAFIPSTHALEFYFPGEPTVDRFGNERPGVGEWEVVPVASWWIDRSEEKTGDSILRTIDMLHIHVSEEFVPLSSGLVRTPDQAEWQIQGNVENYNHGWHGWAPGLGVVHATRVEG